MKINIPLARTKKDNGGVNKNQRRSRCLQKKITQVAVPRNEQKNNWRKNMLYGMRLWCNAHRDLKQFFRPQIFCVSVMQNTMNSGKEENKINLCLILNPNSKSISVMLMLDVENQQ